MYLLKAYLLVCTSMHAVPGMIVTVTGETPLLCINNIRLYKYISISVVSGYISISVVSPSK